MTTNVMESDNNERSDGRRAVGQTRGASNDSTAGVGNPAPLHWPRTAQHTRDTGHRTRERRVQTAIGQTSITTALNIGTVNTDDERKKTGTPANRER